MPKDRFLRSLSGTRYVRLSKVSEFKVSETCSFPEPFQLAGKVGGGGAEWVTLFKGTRPECEAHLEEVLREDKP